MADGSTKAIEEIVVGDHVLSDDPTDGVPPDGQMVEEIHRTTTYRVFHVEVGGKDGGEVVSTGRHPFWSRGAWVAAEDLVISDLLTDNSGAQHAIRTIAAESRDTPTFNLA